MKKLIVLLVSLFIFTGCSTSAKVTLDPKVTVDYFYVESCGECKNVKKAMKQLQSYFGDSIVIHGYDLDDDQVEELYDAIVMQLDDFDEVLYGQAPMIVVEDYFVLVGYNASEEDLLISDIVNATQGKALSDDLAVRRFLYK